MIHMALHLKSINPRASEYSRSVYRKKLRKFEDKSNLVRYLGKSMDAQHTANRPLGFDGKLSEFLDMKDEGASVFGTGAPPRLFAPRHWCCFSQRQLPSALRRTVLLPHAHVRQSTVAHTRAHTTAFPRAHTPPPHTHNHTGCLTNSLVSPWKHPRLVKARWLRPDPVHTELRTRSTKARV